MKEILRLLIGSPRVRITFALIVICGVAAATWWHYRPRPLSRAECAEQAQDIAIGCGVDCSAKLARSQSPSAPKDFQDCNDRCSARLAQVVKACGR